MIRKSFARLTTWACIIVGLLFSQGPATSPANAGSTGDFMVQYDQVRLLRLDEPVVEVIIGNPSIADVVVQGRKILAITGKTFGVTNLIVLDDKGRVVVSRRLVVRSDDTKIVNLQRGGIRQSYNCSPICQPVLNIGDAAAFYQTLAKSSQTKISISSGAADGSGSGG